RVRLTWQLGASRVAEVAIQRRTSASDWSPIGTALPDGAGRVTFEDRGVTAGGRYAYRLIASRGAADALSEDVWVSVPLASAIAIAGLHPNPAGGAVRVDFSLGGTGPARLDVFDLSGRRGAPGGARAARTGRPHAGCRRPNRVPAA